MESANVLLLNTLKASLMDQTLEYEGEISESDLANLLTKAEIHSILPMIYNSIYAMPAVQSLHPRIQMYYRMQSMRIIAQQTLKTNEFSRLYQYLQSMNIHPIVVKGIICRSLYPNPDARKSSDEDLLISPEEFPKVHKAMLDYGMIIAETSADTEKEFEITYQKKDSPLKIELHKSLFPPESEAYGNLNLYFKKSSANGIEQLIGGVTYRTMNPTDHLLYLILHSFKHFLHSGFGIRQICDITLYANQFGDQVNWNYLLKCCRETRSDLFAAAIFLIGEKYLTFDPGKACYPSVWSEIDIYENAMLEDLLASGVYGQADMSRKHSSNITLNAVVADKRGENIDTSPWKTIVRSVFLPAKDLSGRFVYLQKMPFLLPVAWLQRIWFYFKETAGKQNGNSAAESIKIGNERVELLSYYGIIKK